MTEFITNKNAQTLRWKQKREWRQKEALCALVLGVVAAVLSFVLVVALVVNEMFNT